MNTKLPIHALLGAFLLASTTHLSGRIHPFDAATLGSRTFDRLTEIDFEDLDLAGDQGVPNPLSVGGATFFDPTGLGAVSLSPVISAPDPDNAQGENIILVMDPGATISFERPPKVVVVDIQAIGDHPFELLVTDGRGVQQRVSGRGRFVVGTLLGMFSSSGIARIEVIDVGGVGMPLFVARILFSHHGRSAAND